MAKIIPISCIACEVRGSVTTTKNGYRCGECGAVWVKDKKSSKPKPKK